MRLMNAFGSRFRHTVISAMPEQMGAADAIDAGVAVAFPTGAPPLAGRPDARSAARARPLSGWLRPGADLQLGRDGCGLRPAGCSAAPGPPLVHHEDGFGADEAAGTKRSRDLYRRLALPTAHAVVVPSETLERIATAKWGVARPIRIANGIALDRFATPAISPWPAARSGRVRVATVAGLRAVKNLPRLVRAVAGLNVELVIAGEGPERGAIAREAARLGLGDRLLAPGFLADPARLLTHADIFALSSDSEQFPISVVEAMAAGLPVVSTDVGDVRRMVADANRPFIVPDEQGLSQAIATLAADEQLRATVGGANRAYAFEHFDERAMIDRYDRLYAAALAVGRG